MTFAILGLGGRGSVYARFIREEGREIVAVCDTDRTKLERAKFFGVKEKNFYTNEEEFFSKGKLADALVISTLDPEHHRQTLRALEIGYDILLEKPIATSLEDCLEIQKKAEETGRKVVVCHVLRYSPFYATIKEMIDSQALGKVMSLSLTEEIGYYHYAHSYVRGNWRNEQISTPLILAKNCHDLDMICWLLGKNCEYVSSFGTLQYFKEENAPDGAAKYCCDCKYAESCEYSALKIYQNESYEKIAGLAKHGRLGETNEKIVKSLHEKDNLYARCVFHSDNDICDHQIVNMQFEDGILAQFHSVAFSERIGRNIQVYCQHGKIWGLDDGHVYYQRFGGEIEKVEIHFDTSGYSHHAGGDAGIVKQFIEYIENGNKTKSITEIERSMLSHKLGFLAEISRKAGGKSIEIK